MGHDDLLRDFGILPDGQGKSPGRVRSTLKWHNTIFQITMTLLLAGGLAVMGLWMGIRGLQAWGQPDALGLILCAPMMLGLAAFLAYHGAGDTSLWVESDGDEIRARHLYTHRVTHRRVGEIEEVRTLYFALRGDVRTVIVESFVGRVRGFEVRFPGLRRGIRVFRPEMTHVPEFMQAVLAAMARKGEIVPEVIDFEGRPMVKRIAWAPRGTDEPRNA